jgi:hypothetical protein
MKPQLIIRTGITASAMAHLSVLMLVLFFTEVHPFASVKQEPIAVDLVTPAEAEPPPKAAPPPEVDEPPPAPNRQPSETLDLPSKFAAPMASPPAAAKAASTPPQKQAALSTPRPSTPQANAQPASPPPPPSTLQSPGYLPPEPDLSVKYHVMLGLPPALPANGPRDRPGDGFDAPASKTADIASGLVAEFRQHLKTCSKLPPSIEPSEAQNYAAGHDDAASKTCGGADSDRGQRLRQGAGADAKRDRST